MNNLFIALAREAGLEAYMVRVFRDIDNGYVGEHRVVGIVTNDNRLILVDLTWYGSFDVLYKDYLLLDDKQNLSYYLTGFNRLQQEMEPFLQASLKLFPKNELTLLFMAQRAIRRKTANEAESYLNQVPDYSKGFSHYWTNLYDLEKRLKKDNQKALSILKESENYVSNAHDLLERRGDLERELGNHDQAIKYYKKAIQAYPLDGSNAWIKIAYLEMEKKNYSSAITAYRNSLAFSMTDEGKSTAWLGIALNEGKRKNYQAAIAAYQKSLAYDNPKVKKSDVFILIGEAWRKIASIEEKRKNYDAAIAAYRQSLEYGNDHDRKNNKKLAELYQLKKDYHAALEYYIKAAIQGDASAQYNLALMYKNGEGVTQNYQEAVKWYEKAEPNYGKNKSMLFNNLGVSYKALGQFQKAEQYFLKAIQEDDKYILPLLKLGKLYQKQERWDEANKAFEQALSISPLKVSTLKAVLKNYESQGKIEQGFQILEPIVRAQKEKARNPLWEKLGSFADVNGKNNKALEYYLEISPHYVAKNKLSHRIALICEKLGQPENAEAYHKQAVKEDASNVSSVLGLANFYRNQKRWQEAKALYEQALRISVEYRTVIGVLKYYAEQNKWQDGFEKLEPIIAKQKKQANLWSIMGDMAKDYGYYKQAETYYLKAVQSETSQDYSHHIKLATLFQNQKRWEEANNVYEQAINISMDYSTVEAFLNNYYEQNKLQQGFEELEAIISKQKEFKNSLWGTIGDVTLNNFGLYQRAVDYYLKARAENDKAEQNLNGVQIIMILDRSILSSNIAFCYDKLNQLPKAEDNYLQAIQEKGKNIFPNQNIVYLYTKQKKWDKAKQVIDTLNALAPNNHEAYALYGHYYVEKGERDKAREWYLKSLENKKNITALAGLFDISNEVEQEAIAEESLKAFPYNPSSHHMKSIVKLNERNYEQALAHIKNGRIWGEYNVYLLLQEAEILAILQRYEEVEQLIRSKEILLKSNQAYDYASGQYFPLKGDYTQGLSYLEKVQPSSDFFQDAALYRAYIYTQQEQYTKAIEILRFIAEKDKRNPWAWFYIAENYFLSHQIEKAEKACHEYRRLNPPDYRSQILTLYLAHVKKDETALKAAYKQIKAQPFFETSHLKKVFLLSDEFVQNLMQAAEVASIEK